MIIKESYFDQSSELHGVMHTYRVMYLILKIGSMLDKPQETEIAFNAAFIHDMARRSDNTDPRHGVRAARYKTHLLNLDKEDVEIAKKIVINHCESKDLPVNDKCYLASAILKDADALDAIRIGSHRRLRLDVSKELITTAKELYLCTKQICTTEQEINFVL